MRITIKMLESKIKELNKLTNQPKSTGRIEDGRYKYNVGNYHLEIGFKGVNILQTINQGGGVITPINPCTMPKRQLWGTLCSFIDGVKVGKNLTN